MTEEFLFPELVSEGNDYKEAKKFDHLVGEELTGADGRTYGFVAQLKNKEGNELYKVVTPSGKLDMLSKSFFDKKDNLKLNQTKITEITLSEDQEAVYDYIANDPLVKHQGFPDWVRARFYFLTGGAGTGKTTMVRHVRKRHHTKVTGSTGMAAQQAKGESVYRFLGIRPEHVENGIPPKDDFLKRKIGSAGIIVIDEVSMVGLRLFELIFEALASYEVKVIFVGDFAQLPPVKDLYCFTSKYWQYVTPLNLTTNHRQSADAEFFNALNELRWGHVSEYMHNLLNERRVDKLPKDCVNIMSKRNVVENVNNKRLRSLGTEIHSYEAEILPKDTRVDDYKANSLIKSGRIPATVKLAVGARVMFLTNHQQGFWVNGSLGTVIGIKEHNVKVKLDKGYTIVATYETHEITDSDGKTLVSYSQLPMDLAWAMTVHKAQGTSVDKVGVDLTNHFAAGMTYVALSRSRTPEGLFVKGRLGSAIADPRVINLYKQYMGY
jgi:ATP-dependent exoDNAse (exonuclease V) alpha subunit